MARLIMRRGPTGGAIFPLHAEVITIGRGSKNTIVIQDNEISRDHCRLVRVGDDYELQDLNSSNGTFVNGQRLVRNWRLRHGYLVELGDAITLEYERSEPDTVLDGEDTETQDAATTPDDAEVVHYGALAMRSGPEAGRVYTLVNPLLRLGRDLSNDIIVQDAEVSREHALIRRVIEGYEIEDLGSTNGTQVNGEYLYEPVLLQTGDTVLLGTSVELEFLGMEPLDPSEATSSLLRQYPPELAAYFTDTYQGLESSSLGALARPLPKTSRLGTGITPGALENHVYLAYARDDWEPTVAPLTAKLQDVGVSVWVDQYLAEGGTDWREAAEQALYECWLLVVVLTPGAAQSAYVKMAYRYFVTHDKPLIAILSDPAQEIPLELARQRAVLHDADNPTRSLHKLVFEIMEMRKQMRP